MMIPQVVFKRMSLEENIDLIKWAVREDNGSLDVHKYTLEYYPELAILNENSTEEEIDELVSEVVSKIYKENYSDISTSINRYKQIWKKYNDKYLNSLANYLNISWPDKHPSIEVSVGLIPVFPRWLEDYSFALTINLRKEKLLEIIAHEICHFLWFEKWQQLYPNCPKKEYNSPYLPWQYSEMVVDPILNSREFDPLFYNKFIERAYDSFYKIKYKDKYIMDELKKIYATTNSIEDKIKTGYKYIQEALNNEKKAFDVTVFGGCSVDEMYYQLEDDTYPEKPNYYVPGGSGANQAVAASRAGARVNMISRIGNDNFGKEIIKNLNNNGIITKDIEILNGIKNDTTKIFVNNYNADNKKERLTEATNSFTTDMIDTYKDDLLASKVVLSQSKVPKEVIIKLIDYCYDNDITLIITPSCPEKLKDNIKLLDKITYITCNEEECKTIFANDNIEKMVERYPNKLIVTLNSNGLIYHNGKKTIHLPAINNPNVVDTTGAGDTFTGNLAANIIQGIDLKDAIFRAQLASTIKLSTKSAQSGMPYKEQLDKYLDSYIKYKKIDWQGITNKVFTFNKDNID